tara:strand:+ start:24 stop:299 length:276 start_codon:yes stop_codon:yes gene_type:complete
LKLWTRHITKDSFLIELLFKVARVLQYGQYNNKKRFKNKALMIFSGEIINVKLTKNKPQNYINKKLARFKKVPYNQDHEINLVIISVVSKR